MPGPELLPLFWVLLGLLSSSLPARSAAFWPTYRHDIARTGASAETVRPPLSLRWVFRPGHKPRPAWPMPAEEPPRMHEDNAFHVVAAEGLAFFGSSVDDAVYAVEAATGRLRWRFQADGPVRYAPTWRAGRLYFGSDDGFVYCLDARAGRLLWKYRPGPSSEKVIGNGRVISMWPVRTSVLVDRGQVLCTAGVFPFEGLYICALDPKEGRLLWKNDTIGDRAHDLSFGGISPTGYLVASKDTLFVPSGRAMPAAFDRKTGRFLYYASPRGKRGGTWALLDKDTLIAGVANQGSLEKEAYDARTGRYEGPAFAWFHGRDMVVTAGISYILAPRGIYALDRKRYAKAAVEVRVAERERTRLRNRVAALRRRRGASRGKERKGLGERIRLLYAEIRKLSARIVKARASAYLWSHPAKGVLCLALAGRFLYCGGEGFVSALDGRTGKETWRAKVEGRVCSLAPAGGMVFAASDAGPVFAFGPPSRGKPLVFGPGARPLEKGGKDLRHGSAERAEEILRLSGIRRGYCLFPEGDTGGLAAALAVRSKLRILVLQKDRVKLRAARKAVRAAGLPWNRVSVEPWEPADLPRWFANLVVLDRPGRGGGPGKTYLRLLRPYGGVFLAPRRGGKGWDKFVRPPLKGAGTWTQLYGNPANTACSGDELVKGPFGLQWFGDPGPRGIVDRHARSAAPVVMEGRFFQEGAELVQAYDAFNGTFLWRRRIPGAVRVRADVDGGNLALARDGLYVAVYDKCLLLDPPTGRTLKVFSLPREAAGGPRRWGYISVHGNLLFGTAADPLKRPYASAWKKMKASPGKGSLLLADEQLYEKLHRVGELWGSMDDFPSWGSQRSPRGALTSHLMAGDALFALDRHTGRRIWIHKGKEIPNIAVCIGGGKVFLVEGRPSEKERKAALAERKALLGQGLYEAGEERKLVPPGEEDVRIVYALEERTGKVLWRKPLDVTGCGGDKMGSAYARGVLLFYGDFSNHDTGLFLGKKLTWRRVTALDGASGRVLWSKPLNYLRRPLVVGRKIIVEPRACDLFTGKILDRLHPVTGKPVTWEFLRPGHCCAITSASAHALFYRSFYAAIYELKGDKGINLFGAIRPGCWLNMVPACGLMVMPEASSGCTCSFPIRCSIALVPRPDRIRGNWTVFVCHGPTKPVKHLSLNLGAPGDLRDKDGTLWLAWPRPRAVSNIGYGHYAMKLYLKDRVLRGMGYARRDDRGVRMRGTDRPWLFTSWCLGLQSMDLPLLNRKKGRKPVLYTVRLGFHAAPREKPGKRVFDVEIQGKVLLRGFDPVRAAGGPGRAVTRVFRGIPVEDDLRLDFSPRARKPGKEGAPRVDFVQVLRE